MYAYKCFGNSTKYFNNLFLNGNREDHVFIQNQNKTEKEWKHLLEITLFRTSCIFGPQDGNISSSCTWLWVSLILCEQAWHHVSKLSMKSIHNLIVTKYISSETCSIYWIICCGKATSVTVRFLLFIDSCLLARDKWDNNTFRVILYPFPTAAARQESRYSRWLSARVYYSGLFPKEGAELIPEP